MSETLVSVAGQSYVNNCIIEKRAKDGPVFDTESVPGQVVARLDGYAIVPREKYDALLANQLPTAG